MTPTTFAEALAIGALAPGVNSATLVALNAAFAAAAAALAGLLCLLLFAERPPGHSTAAAQAAAVLVPHAAAALVLTVALGVAVNLLVSATGGVVGVEAQRTALFGTKEEGEKKEEEGGGK